MLAKKLSNNHIALRLIMLFVWFPFGVFILPKSDIIKRKFWFGLIYFSLWGLVGLPVLLILSGAIEIVAGTMLVYEVVDLFNETIHSFSQCFVFLLLLLLVSVPVYTTYFIKDKNNLKKNELDFNTTNEMEVVEDIKSSSTGCKQKIVLSHSVVSDEKVVFEKLNKSINCSNKSQNVSNLTFEKSLISKSNSYEKTELLSQREKDFYKKLFIVADKFNYTVIAKIRLADLVNVNDNIMKNSSEWWSKFNKISRKHIDFALAQKDDLSIKLLIELDDSTHNASDRQDRDAFVDSVCQQANIPILHVWNANNLEEKIAKAVENFSSKKFLNN